MHLATVAADDEFSLPIAGTRLHILKGAPLSRDVLEGSNRLQVGGQTLDHDFAQGAQRDAFVVAY